MELFKNIPMDIVNHILSYDSRFKIVQGVAIYVPFTKRHQHIIELLKNKKYLKHVCLDRYIVHFSDKKLYVSVNDVDRPSSYSLHNLYEMLYLYSN
jgi:hypothetical protein